MDEDKEYRTWSERVRRRVLAAAGPWKVLIADDDQDVHQVTKLALDGFLLDGRPIEFLHAYSGREAIALLGHHPDTAMILMDVVMESENDGLEAIDVIRHRLGNTNVRIVLRTGYPGRAPERDVLRRYDINDYREKADLTSNRLFTAVYTALRTFELLSKASAELAERKRLEEFARHQASHDPLTQLPNRLLFHDRLNKTLDRCRRRNTSSALLYLDVDDFKPVNDQYGHEAGDALLIEVSRRIAHAVRATDTVARLAGDEFAVIMDEPLTRADVLPVVNRILDEARRPFEIVVGGGPEVLTLQVGISIGAALFPEHAATVDELVRTADDAMYTAKKAGSPGWLLASAPTPA